ncbi:hypothetical protein [Sinorhizobium chiapasense]|uniref:Uncharacterized protein n=1 Tax=Sinorhizobium chiapasense TaxID=501572 RepID=A0ABZ2BAX8_9HYPH
MKKAIKGEMASIRGKVARVWEDGRVTLHVPGLDYPITIHERHLLDIGPAPKPPKPPKPKWPRRDVPD